MVDPNYGDRFTGAQVGLPSPRNDNGRGRSPWTPDIAFVAGFVLAVAVWLTQPDWEKGGLLALLAIGLIIFAMVRHPSHWLVRIPIGLIAISFFIWLVWPTIWESFRKDYPTIAFQWPIITSPSPKESPTPPPAPTPPPKKFYSTKQKGELADLIDEINKTIDDYASQIPAITNVLLQYGQLHRMAPPPANIMDNAVNALKDWGTMILNQARVEIERNVKAWGAMLGFATTVADVEGGIQIIVEAKTIEGRNRFLSAGVSPLATKLILDMRRIGPRIMVTSYPELPQEFSIFSLLPVDPASPQIEATEKQVNKMFGWPEGTCHVI